MENYTIKEIFKKYDLLIILLTLLVANFLLRSFFDLSHHSLGYYFDQLQINTDGKPWYEFMLPSRAKLWGGTLSSFGIGILPIFNSTIGNTNFYLLLNAGFIISAYVLSWLAFRSKIFSITVGICTAFTTFNHHVYNNASLVIIYIPFICCFVNLFAFFKLFEKSETSSKWWYLWGLSLLMYILSFEGWVDYYTIVMICSLFCFLILYKNNDSFRAKRLITIISIMTVAFIIFVYVKVKFYYASGEGKEHDLVFNYGLKYYPLMIEDIIGNIFTFFYTTIITYIPSSFSFSHAYLRYGPEQINHLQNNYDQEHNFLTAYNSIFLWRFYAGAALSVFIFYMYTVGVKVWQQNNRDYFFIFLFMLMILFGAPAHLLIKFRPMHIIPWLAYQAFIGQIGIILFISYLLMMLQKSGNKAATTKVVLLVWSTIIMCAFTKDHFYFVGKTYAQIY